uniref:CYTOSOL_AP domain-containing protein n=1 Tax=Panagrellus redivivus TaxID=6233 RepID=A0A7E4UZ69_PANRE
MNLLRQYAPAFTDTVTYALVSSLKPAPMAKAEPRKSIIDAAANAGLTALNPSDLVFEANQRGIAYYDFVLSSTKNPDGGHQLFLVKFDSHTNVEWFETVNVEESIITKNSIPNNDLAMMTLGLLTWRTRLSRSRILCLVNELGTDSSSELEALKRAANKFKCMHHVLTIGNRRNSSPDSQPYSIRRHSTASHEGMRLRIMMCQTRAELEELPPQAIREARYLLVPNSNPLLCLCFPLT